MKPDEHHRIRGSLKGVATGDAIGKQTETLSREAVVGWYPDGVRGFEGVPGTVIPRYAGNAKREWRIGETTDDTEGTIAVARAILRDGNVHHTSVGRELLTCTKSVHPGVKSLWEFHQAGDPERVTASATMDVALRFASHPLGFLAQVAPAWTISSPAAREASISTHGGALALAAAAATAAAVSAAIDGAPGRQTSWRSHSGRRPKPNIQRSGFSGGHVCGRATRDARRLYRWNPPDPGAEMAARDFPGSI